ncbi:MAG TPA: FMN-binding protein [Fibrobacteraceae bacterium]|nr:FMN-binding protein [Fibrobacteraceae bacterium]
MKAQCSSLRMALTLVAISIWSGTMIVLTYNLTAPLIAKNQDTLIREAALEVCPNAVRINPVLDSASGVRFFLAWDKDSSLAGVAMEADGKGFGDRVRVLYAYNPSIQCIIGFKVVESKETPGIGDRISSDSSFLANFQNLDITHPLVAVKHGHKSQPWEIDGISGATISSKAVAKLLQASVETRLPVVQHYWEVHHAAP